MMARLSPNDGGSSSSTSISSQRNDTDDDRTIAFVLSEEYASLDGAVARRLSNLSSVPAFEVIKLILNTLHDLTYLQHIPRINSFIPTLSDASLDHQRLFQRLNAYGLYEVKVSGDGNCQFRALSDQMYRSPEHHKHVRKEIVKQLKECRSLYEGYVPMKYKHYYKKMAKSGEWGDHVTLQAAADKIFKFGTSVERNTGYFRGLCKALKSYRSQFSGAYVCADFEYLLVYFDYGS
ncbi:putative OTU domain-containing protein [Cocos nucifera]|uniref:Putative OTU domain-containing protein n=1 Tax=Cocos nucifera TaxID=13894 RepID=A0A8K0IXE4_COCNU|nr:putative OTU domain-containing protein [Cocos nucifera]